MDIEVVIPWRGGCPHRERALRWCLARWSLLGWPATIASAPDGEWCKARAVTPAVERSSADLIVMADADVWCEGVVDAVAAVQSGASWAVPHFEVYRLTQESTAALVAGELDVDHAELEERGPYKGHAGGGMVVLPRSVYLDVPLDPRFVGWGREDDAWARALSTLHGDAWRGEGPMVHLWHPPQDRPARWSGSKASEALFDRYRAKKDKPGRMRALLDEMVEVRA